jgi:hypothetical protein
MGAPMMRRGSFSLNAGPVSLTMRDAFMYGLEAYARGLLLSAPGGGSAKAARALPMRPHSSFGALTMLALAGGGMAFLPLPARPPLGAIARSQRALQACSTGPLWALNSPDDGGSSQSPPPSEQKDRPEIYSVERIQTKDGGEYVVERASDGISFVEVKKPTFPAEEEEQAAAPPEPQPRRSSKWMSQRAVEAANSKPYPNPPPPPFRRERPAGAFQLEENRPTSARAREDAQQLQLLAVFGNDKAMLLGSLALTLGSFAFGFAWYTGILERTSASYRLQNDQA